MIFLDIDIINLRRVIMMLLLPKPKSKKWLYVFLLVFIINFLALIIGQRILIPKLSFQNILSFFLLSIVISGISSFGYFGMEIFSPVFMLTNVISITYYFIILIKNNDTGWADLTSIISYLFVLAIGIILGLIGEGINYLIRSKKVND